MTLFDGSTTNIFADAEVSGRSPDAQGDFYEITDNQADHDYWQTKFHDLITSLQYDPTEEFLILFGGVVSDNGDGTVAITECVFKGLDSNDKKRLGHIPALASVSLPSGWNDGRQIWVIAQYDFKLGSSTRTHRAGVSYHYQIEDTYMGDSNGYISTGTDDLFTDSDPTGDDVILGSFTMTGTVYADASVRTPTLEEDKKSFILDYLFPVGTEYAQFPVAGSNTESVAFPTALRPATKFGGAWTEIFTADDAFFKVGTTDHQTRTLGKSDDQMQGHIMALWGADTAGAVTGISATDARNIAAGKGTVNEGYKTNVGGGTLSQVTQIATDGTNGTPRAGTKTEPENYRMKIWKRTA